MSDQTNAVFLVSIATKDRDATLLSFYTFTFTIFSLIFETQIFSIFSVIECIIPPIPIPPTLHLIAVIIKCFVQPVLTFTFINE